MKLILSLILTVLLACSASTEENQEQNKWVYDYENILSEEQELELVILVKGHEKRTTNEIAIVTTPNFDQDSTMFDYSYRWANKHSVGKMDKNNGVVISVSAQQRSIFI